MDERASLTPDPADEFRHAHDGTELWNESYYLDFFAEDLSVGGYLRIGLYPNLNRVWYWACLVGPDRPLVTVIDHDVPLPSSDRSLEIRHDGLWADHIVETPNEHMSVNLEAFALQLDDPQDVYGDARGDRVPFGFELDFLTDRAAYLWPPVTPRYEIPCRVEGEILVGNERISFDGWGQRDHSWGAARDWWANQWSWTAGRLDDGTRWHSAGGFFPDADWGVAYRLDPDSTEFVEGDEVVIESCPRVSKRKHFAVVDIVAPAARYTDADGTTYSAMATKEPIKSREHKKEIGWKLWQRFAAAEKR